MPCARRCSATSRATAFPVVVRRDGKEQTVTARTAESGGRTVMGVGLRLDYDLPVDVTLRTGNVGGPSAGLMFSLAIYDALTPGELTGGKNIAGTGTMDDDGRGRADRRHPAEADRGPPGRRRLLPRPRRQLRRGRRATCPTACGSSRSATFDEGVGGGAATSAPARRHPCPTCG